MSAAVKPWQDRIVDGCHTQAVGTSCLVSYRETALITARDAEIADLRAALAAKTEGDDANWKQVAHAQNAKLMAMAREPGGMERLRGVLAEAAPVASTPHGTTIIGNEELAALYKELSGKQSHASDCATSNAPAETPGRCDCSVPAATVALQKVREWAEARNKKAVSEGYAMDEVAYEVLDLLDDPAPAVQQGGEAARELIAAFESLTDGCIEPSWKDWENGHGENVGKRIEAARTAYFAATKGAEKP